MYDPEIVPNNKFGVHIMDANDLYDAKNLVNTSGGDWGYVTLVVQQGDRNHEKWQQIFDQMRRLHLIPIIRIASRPIDDTWDKPALGDIDGWVSFLDSLNWVIKNRYVVIGNEPNHAKEWGGELNPEEYAQYLKAFSDKLKIASTDFFILPAGLDASATKTKITMEESAYLDRMFQKEPDLFSNIDGWTSHSYPNPAFSGNPQAEGKGTVRSFQWELEYLKKLGVTKELPVFITETGWVHREENERSKLLDPNVLGDNYQEAFANAWNDNSIIAVTPFILNYQEAPFNMFSWKKKDGSFYDFYNKVAALPKTKGEPIQVTSGTILSGFTPQNLLSWDDFYMSLIAVNTGQTIWNKDNLSVYSNTATNLKIRYLIPESVEPGKIALIAGDGTETHAGPFGNNFLQLSFKGVSFSNRHYFNILKVGLNTGEKIINFVRNYRFILFAFLH